MRIEEIAQKLNSYRRAGQKMFTSSSFQTHSLVMLHIISRLDNRIPVYFLNTGYLFPETVAFKDFVAKEFRLNVVDLKPHTSKELQKDRDGLLLYSTDPDHCCYLNKTQPMEPILASHDVWINGVRADQSVVRQSMKVEQPAPFDTIRFHPMLDWSQKEIFAYIREHDLPRHPLDSKGYASIGCEPCTRRLEVDMTEREARWFGLNKVECGLHTDLINKE